mgnify:CR=1 FL=1
MAKKINTKKEETINLDAILFKCRDILRQAKNSGSFFEKRDMMLTLVFLRFIGEKYENGVVHLRTQLIEEGLDPDDENIISAFFDDATFTDGTYNLSPEARWSTIINTPAPGLNVALDTALRSIATATPSLKGCFVEGTFTQRNMAGNDMKKLVDEVNKISHKAFGEEKDLIGRVYEYFLKEFAVNATKEEGEFYTPHDIVQLIASMIEPFDGTIYDPCCGSGGMFIQSAELVKSKQGDISRINVYGQEKEAATYRLAKMNLALRGISHNLGAESDSTFTNDLHKGLYFDYIMANPPFNLKGWYNDNLKNDARWSDYDTPPESNANYAWILHMLSHLKHQSGVAGFLLANGALGDTDAQNIRRKLIENDKVEAIIVLPRELFITTDISVTLWILNQNKKGDSYHGRSLRNREHEILFINKEALTVLNLKREDVIRHSAEELSLKNDLLRRLVRELITPGEKKEPLKIYADNKESYFQASYITIINTDADTDEPQNLGDVILLKNITEFKELDSAKTTFISTISHELKTPISAILMSLQLLEDKRVGALNDEQEQLSKSIKENADRLLGITGELLNMTQVEAGKLQMMPKITKPIELIEYAIKANQVQADKFGIQIEVEYPEEKMPKLFVDSEKIAWVLTNLLSNAVRYSKENGRVVIGAKREKEFVELYVQDFGKGIDPRYHQSIFDRYFRVPGTKVQGSGLGLSISKDFVEAHGGTLTVESELGKGSKFIMRLKA